MSNFKIRTIFRSSTLYFLGIILCSVIGFSQTSSVTKAAMTISGKVTTANGGGISGVPIDVYDSNRGDRTVGTESTTTDSNGNFSVGDWVNPGDGYAVEIHNSFIPPGFNSMPLPTNKAALCNPTDVSYENQNLNGNPPSQCSNGSTLNCSTSCDFAENQSGWIPPSCTTAPFPTPAPPSGGGSGGGFVGPDFFGCGTLGTNGLTSCTDYGGSSWPNWNPAFWNVCKQVCASPESSRHNSCTQPISAPTNLKAQCSLDGKFVTLSWSPSAGAFMYTIRVNNNSAGSPGWMDAEDFAITVSGTSYTTGSGSDLGATAVYASHNNNTTNITEGDPYDITVQASSGLVNGPVSSPADFGGVTCVPATPTPIPSSTPVPTATATPIPGPQAIIGKVTDQATGMSISNMGIWGCNLKSGSIVSLPGYTNGSGGNGIGVGSDGTFSFSDAPFTTLYCIRPVPLSQLADVIKGYWPIIPGSYENQSLGNANKTVDCTNNGGCNFNLDTKCDANHNGAIDDWNFKTEGNVNPSGADGDFDVWEKEMLSPGSTNSDCDGDGVVTLIDFNLWRNLKYVSGFTLQNE